MSERAIELRAPGEIADWLAAGLALRRVGGGDARQFLSACANELPELPPPGVIADIAALLGGERLPIARAAVGPAALRAALRAYDDDVLARLAGAARWSDVLAAYAHVSASDRPAAAALVVGAISARLGIPGTRVSPAALRRALAAPPEPAAAPERFAGAYDQLARAARRTPSLVEPRDVFALDHLHVLRDHGARLTADHIAAAADAIERSLPRRLPARRLARGSAVTYLADESQYPAGGFAAITAGGGGARIENLVPSELAYMDDEPGAIDAFTVRYAEGELLHYTRDDSAFHRRRRTIAFALGADLAGARVKDRDLPWQRLVAALGWLVAITRWLAAQLGEHALAIRIAFPPELAEERAIVALLLEAELRRGVAIVDEATPEAVVAAAARAAATSLADLISIARSPALTVPCELRALQVSLAHAAPAVDGAAHEAAEPWQRWCDAAEALLRWLV